VVCLGPRVPGEIVGPRPLSEVGARPLNFTVRRRHAERDFFWTRDRMKLGSWQRFGRVPSFKVLGMRALGGSWAASSNHRWRRP
jgi:hypothetical protein